MRWPPPDRIDAAPAPPLVSVVIPTWQRRRLVQEAIDSALSRTHRRVEVVVVDDGSTDGTHEALASRYASEPRVRLLRKENGGCASARNAGVAAARGSFVAFLDSDDLCRPRRVEAQLEALARDPSAALCICNLALEGDTPPATMFSTKGYRAPLSLLDTFAGAWAAPSSMMLRTDIARTLAFDESLPWQEDTDFYFRFHLAGHRAVLVHEPLTVYRHSGNQMTDRRDEMDRWRARLLERYAARRPAAPVRRLVHMHRWLARHYRSERRWGDAAPHCWAWWWARPLRMRPLWYALQATMRSERPHRSGTESGWSISARDA